MNMVSTSNNAPTNPTTVLLVDDESAITLLYEIELTRMGYKVLTTHNGSDAHRIGWNLNRPLDVLVADWRMPGMTGDELARHLLSLRPTLKVILMSGYEGIEEITREFDLAQVTYLKKPFSPAVLHQVIQSLLALHVEAAITATGTE
jgi:two-component system, cell cycle sensor histidine kinase and response regulator CckA